jgi:hypothetical protein
LGVDFEVMEKKVTTVFYDLLGSCPVLSLCLSGIWLTFDISKKVMVEETEEKLVITVIKGK